MTTTEHRDVVEGEIVDGITPQEPPAQSRPEPPAGKTGAPKGEIRPLLASWLRDRGEFTEKVTDTSRRAAHTTAWHVLHSPLHFLRAARYAPRGLWRVSGKAWGWTLHAEVRPMQRAHALTNNSPEWHKLEKERKEAVRRRWKGVAWLAVLALVCMVLWWWLMPRWQLTSWPVVWVLTPWWTLALLAFLAVWPLGYYGRPVDAPLIKRATAVNGSPPLRSETVVNALVSLRIPGMTKPEDIRLLHDISGPSAGYLFEMELPPGITGEAVMEKRPELSAALRHPLGTVWPSVGKRHQGHLVLFVSHEDMNSVRQKAWPLMRTGAVDVFTAQPLFTDQRNRWVKLTLAYTSGVIGAVPRMGKALALDTPVPTPSGWTTMGQLRDGDEVFDETGAVCRVVTAHDVRHGRPCYEVEFSDGSVITADAEHLWQVETRSGRVNNRPEKVLSTAEMVGRVRVEADDRINYSVRVAGALQTPDADLPVPPYTLGAWLGDGTGITGVITSPDPDVVAAIEAEGETVRLVTSTAEFTSPGWRVLGLTARLRDELHVLDNKHVPAAYFRASESQRRALLAGLLDTDGWCEKWGTVRFSVTSQRLAEDVRRLVATLGYKSTLRSRPARLNGHDYGTSWEITFCPDEPVFWLSRKASRQSVSNKASNKRRFIIDIRPVASVPVRCVTVDSPNSLYLVGEQCIPTHNTFILRELLLVGALDPRLKIYAFDLKGTGDLSPLRLVAHRYECTARPERIAELLPIFEELQAELYRRAEVIEGLSYEECPENKVTPELASRRSLRLEPILIGVDECHELFEHEDPAVRARFIKICTDLVKRGPALGIMLYLATQKPSAASIPTAIADNAVIRVCLKVHNQISNDQVLGTGSSKMGLKAQLFAFEDKGIAYLKGEGADAQIVRSVFGLDAPASERVATRARAARELEGRLTGDASGEEMEREEEQVVLLDDVKRVFGAADVMDVNSIVAGLAALRPELHGGLDSKSLPPQLRRMEVKVDKIHVPSLGRSALAVRREWLNVSTTRLVGDEEAASNVISLTEHR